MTDNLATYAGCMRIPGKVVHSRTSTTFPWGSPYREFPDSISDAAASRAAAYKKASTLALLHVHGHVLQTSNPRILYPDLVSTNESDVTSERNEHRRLHVSRNVCI